jgi:hypothetical protein
MLRTKLLILIVVALTSQLSMVSEAQAGPLLDWLKGIRRNCARPALPQYGFTAPAAQTPNVANLQPGQCLKTCQQTCSRTVVNYVPYTAYRTNWNRVPVTQYRPVTSSDPCTGCTMTCMKPCTTYTYKMQRVPYTTYRPVYRQESYKVPVTTLVNDCNSCNTCNTGCNTCGTGNVGGMQNFAPQQPTYSAPVYSPGTNVAPADTVPTLAPTQGSASRTTVPAGSLSTDASYELQSAYQSMPAYTAPSQNPISALPHTAARIPDVNSATRGVRPQTSQRPFLDRLQNQGSSHGYQTKLKQAKVAPAPIKPKTQLTSLHRRWSYSPVRLASNRSDSKRMTSSFSSVQTREQINSAWDDVK